jgi:hypothetical protein
MMFSNTTQRMAALLGAGALAAQLGGRVPMSMAETFGTTIQEIASVEGGIEAAIDAPWRLEPDYTSTPNYPQIPIVVSIHDSSLQSTQGDTVALGQFCELTIQEQVGTSFVKQVLTRANLSEVERSDKWPISSAPASNHRLCRQWAGTACSAADLDVGPSAEWYGTFLYTPRTQTPGADVNLTVQARVAQVGAACGAPREGFWLDAPFDRFGPAPEGDSYLIVNRLSVHLGEEPLPRFDANWVYGDLHYHSQGTDNEGESAHAYRPTLQAMRAIGLDFLFATEHASDSEQITDVNLIYLRNIDIPGYVPFNGDIENFVESIPLHEETRTYAQRDMSRQRFSALRALLNDPPGVKELSGHTFPTGANAEVMKVRGINRTPRIFLGGEVDVVPEMSASEKSRGTIRYGNNVEYNWRNCLLDNNLLQLLHEYTTSVFCPSPDALAELDPATGRYSVHDIQGLGDDSYYARQHMVYLPLDGTRDDAFVSGETSQFGGAHEHLRDLLDPNYFNTMVGKGYGFLAHPANGETGTSLSRLGPDLIPYSDLQLRTAFESPSILGLQLWNEDTRLRSGGTDRIQGFPLQPFDFDPTASTRFQWQRWDGPEPDRAYSELHHGLAMWDRMLLWGIRPSQTSTLSWLPAGEPRRVFMAGGSDAHGDLNYRRLGRLFGVSGIVDTAIGKPRNLVNVGPERPELAFDRSGLAHGSVSQAQTTSALARGNFSITDGPAVRIALDTNGNGLIDDADVPMGGVSKAFARGTYLPFVIEWRSTDEFGPLAGIDLYVGVTTDALDLGFVYAPKNHGIHAFHTKSGAVGPNPYVDKNGVSHPELRDGYMLDPTGRLHVTISAAEAKAGRRLVYLRANDFVVGRRRVDQQEPECHFSPLCNKPGFADQCEEICSTPPPPTYRFDNVSVPSRIFVRAFARTVRKGGALCDPAATDLQSSIAQRTGKCIERLAFTNPIWVENAVATGPTPQPTLVPLSLGSFTISCTPATVSVPTSGSVSSTCRVTPQDGFGKSVTLGCTGLPAGATCTFTPASVTPTNSASVSSTLKISTTGVPAATYTIRAQGTSAAIRGCHVAFCASMTRDTTIGLTVRSVTSRLPTTGGILLPR